MTDTPLSRVTFINTRPEHQASKLSEQLQLLGAMVMPYPSLTIQPVPPPQIHEHINQLPLINYAIFVSANAVPPIMDCHPPFAQAEFIAIGDGTANALRQYTQTRITQPTTANSEGILALPSLQSIAGASILVGSGHDSRPLLITTLQQRGAQTHHIESYHRIPNHLPTLNPEQFLNTDTVVIILTSLASFQQFMRNIDPAHFSWLMQQQLLVISDQLSAHAIQLGWRTQPWVAPGAGVKQLIHTACKKLLT